MEYLRLGKSGLKVSALSFGARVTFARQSGRKTATGLLETTFDAGIDFFDNAEVYADGNMDGIDAPLGNRPS